MVPPPSRRNILRTSSLALVGGFTGCSGVFNATDDADNDTTDDTNPALPYTAADEPETFTNGAFEIENVGPEPVRATLSISHGGTTFFERTRDIPVNEVWDRNDVTATAGTYTVIVDVADGGRTEYDWRVPPEDGYPRLHGRIPASGTPVVGCGGSDTIDTQMKNETSSEQTVALSLLRDGETVTTESATLAPREADERELPIPIGDFYTLVATTDAGEASTEVVECYCYNQVQGKTNVVVTGSGPSVKSKVLVCD
jgi:hypothetical protein